MKGTGTFRRAMLAVTSLIGSTASRLRAPKAAVPSAQNKIELGPKPRRRSRAGAYSRRKVKNLRVTWGNCPTQLSRKKLKQLAPNHPLLSLGVRW